MDYEWYTCICYQNKNKTDKRESPREAQPSLEKSSLGFIEVVHQLFRNLKCDVNYAFTFHPKNIIY